MKKRSKKKDVRVRLQGFDAMKSNTDDGRGGRGKKRILLRNDQGERGKGKKRGSEKKSLEKRARKGGATRGRGADPGGFNDFLVLTPWGMGKRQREKQLQ